MSQSSPLSRLVDPGNDEKQAISGEDLPQVDDEKDNLREALAAIRVEACRHHFGLTVVGQADPPVHEPALPRCDFPVCGSDIRIFGAVETPQPGEREPDARLVYRRDAQVPLDGSDHFRQLVVGRNDYESDMLRPPFSTGLEYDEIPPALRYRIVSTEVP